MISRLSRNIKYWFQRRTRGWSDDETWNLDYEFIKWVNTRFKKYKEQASQIVDLEYHKFKYKKHEYTQLQIIDRIIEITDYLLNDDCFEIIFNLIPEPEKVISLRDEFLDLFKLVLNVMWW